VAVAAPAPPPEAVEVFGDRLPLARAYADWVAGAGVERGLVGPREVPRLWDRHLLNCAFVEALIPSGATVCDVGSGAGLPGIVLALLRPDLTVVLAEPLLRRSTFLDEVVSDLGLSTAQVVRERAETLPRGAYDVVTARAVAPLERLVGWTLPLLRPGGQLLALKGRTAADELTAARPAIAPWAGAVADVVLAGAGHADTPTTVVRVRLAVQAPRAERRSR
jgi:16S rRNA (guanine527-N7)-methyltransferase